MPATKFGIDGGIAPAGLGPVVFTIGQAQETDTAHPVVSELNSPRNTKFGISGDIANANRDFGGKVHFLGQAQEIDTAFPVIDFSVRAGTIGQANETDTAHPVTFSQPLAITLVSSSRGTNIITANETLTVNVTDSAGVTIVTVNGVTTSLVQIITPTEITCVVPLGIGAQYSTNVDVIADNGTPSPGFSAAWEPPFGMAETDFTTNFAGLDPDSPFAGDPNFSDLVSGDSCINDAVTTPGGNSISMDGLGEFTIGGTITVVQIFNYYIYDLSDNTVSPTIEQITVQPGPVEALIGQAVEIDTAHSVTSNVATVGIIGQANEINTSHPVTDGSIPLQTIGQALEINTGHPVTVGGVVQTFVIGQAFEINTAFPVVDASIPTQTIGQANEIDSAFAVIDAQAVSQLIGQAIEINTAFKVSTPASLESLSDQIDELVNLINTQQLFINDLYTRFDLNVVLPNIYDDDGSLITNSDFILTKTDNGDGTFTITRTVNLDPDPEA